MNGRFNGDASLNAPIREDGDSGEWRDWLMDDHDSQETILVVSEEADNRRAALSDALDLLNDRERAVPARRGKLGISPRCDPGAEGRYLRPAAPRRSTSAARSLSYLPILKTFYERLRAAAVLRSGPDKVPVWLRRSWVGLCVRGLEI